MHVPRHKVTLKSLGAEADTITVDVEAPTPALAATMAEQMRRGYAAEVVWTLTQFQGRCGKCHSLIGMGQQMRTRHGKTVCGECP